MWNLVFCGVDHMCIQITQHSCNQSLFKDQDSVFDGFFRGWTMSQSFKRYIMLVILQISDKDDIKRQLTSWELGIEYRVYGDKTMMNER